MAAFVCHNCQYRFVVRSIPTRESALPSFSRWSQEFVLYCSCHIKLYTSGVPDFFFPPLHPSGFFSRSIRRTFLPAPSVGLFLFSRAESVRGPFLLFFSFISRRIVGISINHFFSPYNPIIFIHTITYCCEFIRCWIILCVSWVSGGKVCIWQSFFQHFSFSFIFLHFFAFFIVKKVMFFKFFCKNFWFFFTL